MNKVTVLFHSADFDGLFCREIARKFFGARATLIGWDYGDQVPIVPWGEDLYMLDISVDGLMDHPRLTWIDHHKTAIDKFSPMIRGYRIDGVAACRLAWQWFFRDTPGDIAGGPMPTKDDFVERRVKEPYAVRLAGEYDIWDKRDPNTDLFQHALRAQELTDHIWSNLLDDREAAPDVQPGTTHSDLMVTPLLERGRAIEYARKESDRRVCEGSAFEVDWEGLRFLALNSGGNSLTFASAEQPHHDGLLMFRWAATKWRVSLYHSQAHKERDLSEIAKKYGGGGHRGACGFECHELPFRMVGTTDWKAVAGEMAVNMEYYRGLVDQIGALFGDAAYICDDGSRSEDILRAKVPELVASQVAENKERRESTTP